MTDTQNQNAASADLAVVALPSRAREDAFVLPAGARLSADDIAAGLTARFVSVDALVPYARNARTHSDAQVAQIAASIEEFGFTNPVLADEKGIVAGHGRVLGARRLYAAGRAIRLPSGLELPANTVPVIDCAGWSDAKRRAYVLADNQLALNAGWDTDLMKLELSELGALDFDLGPIGFDAKALGELLAPAPQAAAEDDGEVEAEAEAPTVIHCPKCAHEFSVLEKAKPKRKKAA